ncbi:MAG: sxtJ [Acidobacteria bacterium]|nr:MAG: sxtJ [Acidobacteriota bacterium]
MQDRVTLKQLRSFGLLVGGVFVLIGLWPVVFRGQTLRGWALLAAGLLVLPAVVLPKTLKPIYRVWMAAGHVLGWINTRIILSVVFYIVFTPSGLIMRLFGKDPMRRGSEPAADTYRVNRHPRPGSHLKQQF